MTRRAYYFLSEQAVLFLRLMVYVYGTAVEVNNNEVLADQTAVCDLVLQFMNRRLALSFFRSTL